MRSIARLATLITAAVLIQGCAAKALLDVATSPVKAASTAVDTAGKAYDRLTVNDQERNENYLGEVRRHEEEVAQIERRYKREQDRCTAGRQKSCEAAERAYEKLMEREDKAPVFKPDD